MVGGRKVSKVNVKFAMLVTSGGGRRKLKRHLHTGINQADLLFKHMLRNEV